MIIFGNGIALHRLEEKHIEMLRNWRNAPEIVQHMEYREHITTEMQKKWFQKIDTPLNFYFIIYHREKAIGMIHLSDIDPEKKCGNVGLFISHKHYLRSLFPVAASVLMLDFIFTVLHLEKVEAKVKFDNARALNYNKMLGFKRQEEEESSEFCKLLLTASNYIQKANRIRTSLQQLYGKGFELSLDEALDADVALYNFWGL